VPAIALFSISVALEDRGRRLASSLALGVALATSLIIWLVVPFYVYRYARSHDLRPILVSAAAFAGICLPFFAANPTAFAYDVLLFQFGRPTPPLLTDGQAGIALNPSLSGLLMTLTGQPAPLYLRGVLGIVLLGLFLFLRTPIKGDMNESAGGGSPLSSTILRSTFFVTAAIVILPSVFFFIYAEFPIVLFLTWLAMLGSPRHASEWTRHGDASTNT
jgi:hypothetical protein